MKQKKHRKPVRREKRINIWVTAEEKERIAANADAARLSVTDWIVSVAGKAKP